MARTWFSYIVLAIGLLMLFASDKHSIADDKETSFKTISFGDSKDIQVFVNKSGDDNASVDLMINGNKHTFTIPEILEGEMKNITTDDGTEIVIKGIEGHKMVFIGDDEIKLPGLDASAMIGKEGLSSIITRVHEVSDFAKDSVTISGSDDLSDDAVKAMVDAVKGVLVSYGIEKEVMYRKSPKFEFIQADGQAIDLSQMTQQIGNFDVKVETKVDGSKANKTFVWKKHHEVKVDKDDKEK